jgi:hypothetical protein
MDTTGIIKYTSEKDDDVVILFQGSIDSFVDLTLLLRQTNGVSMPIKFKDANYWNKPLTDDEIKILLE